MEYTSTRGLSGNLAFSRAVSEGLAPDGGLYVPASIPDISALLPRWEGLSYPDLCFEFLKLFADDIPQEDLRAIVNASYTRFDDPKIAPMRRLDDGLYMLELFHGPTLAFKDFALQFVGSLYEYLLSKSGAKINVLGATSGDTGSAAINGLLGKKNVNIFILYPEGGVSPLQERQMACTGADNVFPIAVRGTFDDAQAIVKTLFGDLDFKAKWSLSAVNSINLARILAQCVYYVYAWLNLPKAERENVVFAVPTGNFGNVFAGWLARRAGLPVRGFRVATNQNDILYRLFKTGVYEVSKVMPSYAPSMDIQVSSNFERFLYYFLGGDTQGVRGIMASFKNSGKWVFDSFKADEFSASSMPDAEIASTIADIYRKYGAVIDPHTACAFKELPEGCAKVVLSTAHAAKFPDLIERSIGVRPTAESLEKLLGREIVKTVEDADAGKIRAFISANGII